MADIAVASKQMEQNIHKIFCKARSLSPLFVYSLWLLGLHTWLVEAVRAPKVQLILFHFHVMPSLKRSKIRMWYTDLLEDVLLIPFSFPESLHLTQRHSKDGGRAPVSKPTNLVFHRFGIAINAFKTSIITSWCFQPISNICCQIGSSPPNKSGWKKTTTTSKNPPTKQTINSKQHQIFPARMCFPWKSGCIRFCWVWIGLAAARQGFTRRRLRDGHRDWDEKHEENCGRDGEKSHDLLNNKQWDDMEIWCWYMYIYRWYRYINIIQQVDPKTKNNVSTMIRIVWQHLKTVWTWSRIAHMYTMACTHTHIYIYMIQVWQEPPHPLSNVMCPFWPPSPSPPCGCGLWFSCG